MDLFTVSVSPVNSVSQDVVQIANLCCLQV